MSAIWVVIDAVRGSAPRDAGTAMKVTADALEGTIGGGALEYRATAIAREMLAKDAPDTTRKFPLGPDLGQCCGGAVTLRFTRTRHATDSQHVHGHPVRSHRPHPEVLWLWGAGHVGRAVIHALDLQACKVTWVDSAADRFPQSVSRDVTVIPTPDMPLLARRAPVHAHHLVFTYSHDIDLALCAALLQRGAASIGLIGSDTKRARFFRRLRAMGLDPAPITCPIGDKSLGKAPAQIARGVVAQLGEIGQAA
ncbi:xanthine dehydrogenase accessory protein XdhC [Pseudaestuariivita atlantica]|uniref:Xanthine dehydrogenase n=1 Tax=Pseudaestuariivita atlantica TaxID=1317121 RepID=A0A0L1JT17_9RHOB|nr:xanthine dehydrogenase accessory protein XdhC [Pseudaestuariivita atlantica]KNG94919.1 xanthine dehydrogenase [Pseudaestuariivita atlantica]